MTLQIRIIRDPSNRDGWIGKDLDTDRVAFISNLSSHILDLSPGQIWEAHLIANRPTYDLVDLTTPIH